MSALRDLVAVVTGAGGAVGRAIAQGLASHGATVCLVGRKLEALESVAESARSTARALVYQADLTVDEDIQELTAGLRRDCGHVDILVHCAGVISLGELAATSVADLDSQYGANVRAPYLLTQALLPLLRPRQGQIVFINSSAGLQARAGVGQYAATKHALKALADSLRDELNGDGVRVLSVYLGRTASPMQAAVHAAERKAYHPERLVQPEDVASVVLNALSLPRTAEVTDISIRPLLKPS